MQPRVRSLVALGVVLGALALVNGAAWQGLQELEVRNTTNWREVLVSGSRSRAEAIKKWLDDRTAISKRIADDGRIVDLLEAAQKSPDAVPTSSPAERAIFEYGTLIYALDNIYVFDDSSRLLLTTDGARELPLSLRQSLSQMYHSGSAQYATLTEIDDERYFIALARTGDSRSALGYAAYAIEAEKIFYELKAHPFKRVNVESYLARKTPEDQVFIVSWPQGFSKTRIQNIRNTRANFPFFGGNTNVFGVYNNPDGAPVFSHLSAVEDYPFWQVAASVNTAVADTDIESNRTLILIGTSALNLILFLLLLGYARRLFQPQASLLPLPQKGLLPTLQGLISGMPGLKNVVTRSLTDADRKAAAHKGTAPSAAGPTAPPIVDAKPVADKPAAKDTPAYDGGPKEPPIQSLPADDPRLIARGKIIQDSLERERIRLFFQPIIESVSEKPVMYETFLRVVDDEGKIMMPGEFIPIAIKRGFVGLIDDTVIVASIRRHIEILTQGKRAALSINLSYGAFSSLKFMETFMDGMGKRTIKPELLNFEISSREIIDDPKALGFIKELKSMNAKISVDYFGGGVATVEAAAKMKMFDYMKIDCLKFKGLDTGDAAQVSAFREIVLRAQEMGLPIIAEKVENRIVLWLCKKLGVPYMQGYHIAEPSPKLDLGW
jgi:EAL domain-containing protein (putative c-di-GMP-specific phosphodiesterase class I)